ncbi:unnamed protein product [Parnassius mnemosyne]|uniref:Reverse transcriptase RNase H-like domain-containing protein n=1 Tax=Parnassius mnemosyne TaxID=213953 RepID=A0AAV1LDS2_9NEOP
MDMARTARKLIYPHQKLIVRASVTCSLYDPRAETHLHTNASKNGLAGTLLQRNQNGVLQPVTYFSRKTTAEEQKYHSFELETLAVIASLQRFRVYLIEIQFTVQTDCNALRSTLNQERFSATDCSVVNPIARVRLHN